MTAQTSRPVTAIVFNRAKVDPRERKVWLAMKVVVLIGLTTYTFVIQGGSSAAPESLLVDRSKQDSKSPNTETKPGSKENDAKSAPGSPSTMRLLSPQIKGDAGPIGAYVFVGTSAPKSKVVLRSNGTRVQSIRADAKGLWKAKIAFDDPGVRELSAQAFVNGQEVGAPATFHLDVVQKTKVTAVPGMSNFVAEKLEEASEPKFEPAPDMTGVFDKGEFTVHSHKTGQTVKAGLVVLEGTAQSGDKVHTFVNGKLRMRSTATADGKWDAPLPLKSPGTRTIKVLNVTQKRSTVLKLVVK